MAGANEYLLCVRDQLSQRAEKFHKEIREESLGMKRHSPQKI